MHLERSFFGAAGALILATLVSRGPARAEDPALEAYMPDNVIGCLRVRDLRARLDEFLASSAFEELKSMDLIQYGLSQGGGRELQKGLAEFHAATGKDLIQVAADLLGKEALVGVRFQFSGPEVLIVSRGVGEKQVEEGLAALRIAGEKKLGRPLEREEATHGDAKIELYEKGKLCIARKGAFIAASNTRSGIEALLDLGAKKSGSSVESAPFFKKGSTAGKDSLALLVVRPRFIPNFQAKEKLDEAGESLLFGGIAKVLNTSDIISAALDVAGGKLQLSTAIHPEKGAGDVKHGAAFFPPATEATELAARLRARGSVAFLHLRRDLARWWEARDEIMSERAAGGLLEFGNNMNQLFGRNFQDEVLPELGPDIVFYARNQEYADLPEKPKPAIPGFALVFELKESKTLGKKMVSAFQALVAIINIDRAQKKKDEGMSMLVRTEKVGKYDLHTVSRDDEGPPGIMHNFTPSLAVAGSKVILSSSAELAKLFLAEVEGKSPAPSSSSADPLGDTITIDGAAVRKILGENHEFLISDNMVKKGHTKEEAEKEIGVLYAILDRLRDLQLRSWKDDDALRIRLELGTKWQDGADRGKTSVKAKADAGVRL